MDSSIGMLEDPLAIHLAISKVAIILMALHPCKETLTIHGTLAETALIVTPICVHCIPLAMFQVAIPFAFVLSHHAIFGLAAIQLQSMSMPDHRECL